MAQPVQQVAIRAPGFQGLNTELSPINGDPEFALVADNVVVDQIGRLLSRKAFGNPQNIGDQVPINIDLPITNDNAFSRNPLAGVSYHDNVVHIDDKAGRFSVDFAKVDGFDGEPELSVYTLKVDVQFDERTGGLIANPASPFPDSIGTLYFAGTGSDPIQAVELYCNHTREDGLAITGGLPVPVPAHRFTYTSAIGVDAREFVVNPLEPVNVQFQPHPDLPGGMGWHIEISFNNLLIDGVGAGERGRNEIITLGKDVTGRASEEQEQADFRPVFIYRYADSYIYPTDARTIPLGMKRKRLTKNHPELNGNIKYAVGSYNRGDDQIVDLSLPNDYETDVLLTGTFVNFNAEDLTTGNDRLLLFVKGKPFLRLENDDRFANAGGEWTDGAGNKYPIDGDIAISAYGRVWVTGVGGDYHQIYYSALLDETVWYDESADFDSFNDAGIIDVREYWPVDGDSIVNIHAHNGYLLVFGRNSILVYANADSGSPAGIINQPDSGIFLQDAISNVGLVRRDAICNIGTDVLFVDDSGVRSLGRVIQEKSNPLQEPSLNIRREIQEVIQTEVLESPSHSAIRFRYMPSESIAVLLFASLEIAYVFHTNMPSKTGGLKVTRWTDCFWNDAVELKQWQEDIVFLGGKPTKGLMKYDGYLQSNLAGYPNPYVMRYESMALALGQSPMQTTIPKSVHYVCMGEFIPGQANALWGFSDRFVGSREFQIEVEGGSKYNVNEFGDYAGKDDSGNLIPGPTDMAGYYPDGGPYYRGYKINTTGSGELFRVGFEVKVQGGRYALQEIDINSAIGRLTA